ncbi:MAG: FAD-dependent oxidoreductase [Candidatus Omnitrophica bacterium]|nr:FAD-dependent oxidoreductase [Candidatus Omnitrophota bacterium]MBU1924637.1 FAD-dependent oxidoreductase [Candidatus Omnitrophota bacterium]
MEKIDTEFLILGAGLSGLFAANLLSRHKKDFIVLEKESFPGGLARTINYKGYKFDVGGHRLNFSSSQNLHFTKDILEGRLLRVKKCSKVFTSGKLVNYPPELIDCFKFFGKTGFKIFLELMRNKNNVHVDSLEEWVETNFGQTLYKLYFKDYTKKVWGIAGNMISKKLAQRRIGSTNLVKMLKNIFVQTGDSIENQQYFYYPEKGMGSIIDKLVENISGVDRVHFATSIKDIQSNNNGTTSLTFIKNEKLYKANFKVLISSIPLIDLLKALDCKQNGFERKVLYRSLILVNLLVDEVRLSDEHWRYIPDPDIIFSRMHEPKNWSKCMVPNGDKTSLCLEIFCDYKDKVWDSDKEILFKKVKSGLRQINPQNGFKITDFCIERIRYAYPFYYLGYEIFVDTIKNNLNMFNNLVLIGRTGTHSYFDIEECFDNVKVAMANLLF